MVRFGDINPDKHAEVTLQTATNIHDIMNMSYRVIDLGGKASHFTWFTLSKGS